MIGGGTSASTRGNVKAGTIVEIAHANDPGDSVGDYLECNGQNVLRTTYATLFSKIGVVWGIGDGATTFTLPDRRRRVAVGKGGAGTATLANTVGSTGGAETETPTLAKTASHNHSASGSGNMPYGDNAADGASLGGNNAGTLFSLSIGVSVNANGSGTALNIVQSAIVCGFWIKT